MNIDAKDSTPKSGDLIYDVGMHKGEDTEYYLKKGFRVVGIEADPELAQACRSRFAGALKRAHLTIVEGAVVDQQRLTSGQETIRFYRNRENSAWGTVCDDWARRNESAGTHNEAIHVRVVDFRQCVKEHGIPHYMKIDVEGVDIVCLQSLMDFANQPDYVSIESEKVSFARLEGEFGLLEELGYREFKAVPQVSVASQVSPVPSREGSSVVHEFQRGCSGLFGKDLPGEWKNREQILEDYRKIFIVYRLLGDYSVLRRLSVGRLFIKVLAGILRRPIPGWYDTHAKHSSVIS